MKLNTQSDEKKNTDEKKASKKDKKQYASNFHALATKRKSYPINHWTNSEVEYESSVYPPDILPKL